MIESLNYNLEINDEYSFWDILMKFAVCWVSLNLQLYITASDMEGKTEEEIEMMKIMGFGDFDTTKVSTSMVS